MSAPLITLYDTSDANLITSWEVGTIKAQQPTEALKLHVWNNKNGSEDVSDLKECEVMVLDSNGSTYESDVPKYKWVQINCPAIDGNSDSFTAIGGETKYHIKADGGNLSAEEYTIKGTANNGDYSAYPENVSTVNLRMEAPINSTPGDKTFKVRILGYYT